jgi:hypothetical protein
MEDRRAWLDHIFSLPTRDAVGSHIRQRCRWIYGTGQQERLDADVRAFMASWVTRRDLDEQLRIKEARDKEMALADGVGLLPLRLVHGQAGADSMSGATFHLDKLPLPQRGQYQPGDRIEVKFVLTIYDVYQQGKDTMLAPGDPEQVTARVLPRRPVDTDSERGVRYPP